MKVAQIGERKLIDRIGKLLALEVNEDCAKLPLNDEYLLLSTDRIDAPTHIPPEATPYQIGWHLAAINFSDICAKGGKPLALLLALGLPRTYKATDLEELIHGADSCAKRYGTPIMGGDTKESKELSLSGACVGKVDKHKYLAREGAGVGDVVCVTGELGKAGAAFYCKDVEKLLIVRPRVREGVALAKSGAVTACMDNSDGLAYSLHQLARASQRGFEIEFEKLPICEEVKTLKGKSLEELALYWGGDYELVFTVAGDRLRELTKLVSTKITPIGVVKEKHMTLVKEGKKYRLKNKGWEHFRRQGGSKII